MDINIILCQLAASHLLLAASPMQTEFIFLRRNSNHDRICGGGGRVLVIGRRNPSLELIQTSLGETHGRRSRGRGDNSPPEFRVGTVMQMVPLRFCHNYKYKKERSVAFKIRQNPFSAGLCPDPAGSSRRSPGPLLWRGDTPPHIPPQPTPTHLLRLPCVPHNSSLWWDAFDPLARWI